MDGPVGDDDPDVGEERGDQALCVCVVDGCCVCVVDFKRKVEMSIDRTDRPQPNRIERTETGDRSATRHHWFTYLDAVHEVGDEVVVERDVDAVQPRVELRDGALRPHLVDGPVPLSVRVVVWVGGC